MIKISLVFDLVFVQEEYDQGVQDCDTALAVSEGSRRALYRKALCLRELGRFREAYECGTGCLLAAPHVSPSCPCCHAKTFVNPVEFVPVAKCI